MEVSSSSVEFVSSSQSYYSQYGRLTLSKRNFGTSHLRHYCEKTLRLNARENESKVKKLLSWLLWHRIGYEIRDLDHDLIDEEIIASQTPENKFPLFLTGEACTPKTDSAVLNGID